MFYACGVSVCDGRNKKASFWLPAKKAQDLPWEVVYGVVLGFWFLRENTCFAWAGGTCPRFAWAGGTFFPVVLLCQFLTVVVMC